ncbi:hypothetical protein [Bacillus sp. ISL-37]|uniref:hypothetical protein n=1 Tax=Bacillus sp. ISL-37 TaxID=2819123 RepID=UPI001BE5E3FC|nr:hypothetical protein [Bacillus sp. ISL-37]MBT2684738.1 hypothetical protein [Bacillus sp. ISL-37]
MKLRLMIILLLISVLAGCKKLPPDDLIISYGMNSIEDKDQDKIQRWLHEPNQTGARITEFNDENNGRHYVYAHSSWFSEVDVVQKGDALLLMFKNEKVDGSGKDAFVKINFNPDIIKEFVLDSE